MLRVLAHACAGATVAVFGSRRRRPGSVLLRASVPSGTAAVPSAGAERGAGKARTCLQTLRELAPRSLQQRPSPRVRRCNLSMKAHLSLQGNRGEGEQRQGARAGCLSDELAVTDGARVNLPAGNQPSPGQMWP